MGFDYALVHLYYTIPPTLLLAAVLRPLSTRTDVHRLLALITIAVVATVPWDSYLIRHAIWTYPAHAVLGEPWLAFSIPAEELFFFVVQTCLTSLLYLLVSRPTFHPAFLPTSENGGRLQTTTTTTMTTLLKWIGAVTLSLGTAAGVAMVAAIGGHWTYMGLILAWACPFLLFLWVSASHFILTLPLSNTLLPAALPTAYLWLVDMTALRRGTWVIQQDTKLGIFLLPDLEIEEAVFFLLTNLLVVFGQIAYDYALTVCRAMPEKLGLHPCDDNDSPGSWSLLKAVLLPVDNYDKQRIEAFRDAIDRLRRKSRSFYLASAAFSGGLRYDMVLLYSFCRVADDLVDNAVSTQAARESLRKLRCFLDASYSSFPSSGSSYPSSSSNFEREKQIGKGKNKDKDKERAISAFPSSAHLALRYLPTDRLPSGPLYQLLEGFEIDLDFAPAGQSDLGSGNDGPCFPIVDEAALRNYAFCVASTVAEACISLARYHFPGPVSSDISRTSSSSFSRIVDLKTRPSANNVSDSASDADDDVVAAGREMGIALQLVNIARDVAADAKLGRVYVPTTWLREGKDRDRDQDQDEAKDSYSTTDTPSSTTSSEQHHHLLHPSTFVLSHPDAPRTTALRLRLLAMARRSYAKARPAIERLPPEVVPAMRVAVESYMEIGRVLERELSDSLGLARERPRDRHNDKDKDKDDGMKSLQGRDKGTGSSSSGSSSNSKSMTGRATVPKWRRLVVAWKALNGW